MSTDYISDCCGAGYHDDGSKEGTRWYACDTCGEPCNTIRADAPLLANLRKQVSDALARVEAQAMKLVQLEALVDGTGDVIEQQIEWQHEDRDEVRRLKEKLARVEALASHWEENCTSDSYWYFVDGVREALEEPKEEK